MNKTLAAAINEHIKPLDTFYPTSVSAAEHESMKRAEAEHAPGVAVRMNPRTFQIEYYRVDTGEVVSSHV